MKNRTINTEFIWNKWAVEKLTFAQIANLDIPRTVGMKRIKNIVYAGRHDATPDGKRNSIRTSA